MQLPEAVVFLDRFLAVFPQVPAFATACYVVLAGGPVERNWVCSRTATAHDTTSKSVVKSVVPRLLELLTGG